MTEFTVKQAMVGEELVISLFGNIHEDSEFPPIAKLPAKVRIDLAEVKSINSIGIREWLNWIKPIAAASRITLEKCPKAIVFQLNMVEGFLPENAWVSSFCVPFFCETCETGKVQLLEIGKDIAVENGTYKALINLDNAVMCDTCKKPMIMDVSEKKYFQFLSRLKK
jgi:hypothetical protein